MKREIPSHWGDKVDYLTTHYGPIIMGIDPNVDDIPETFLKRTNRFWLKEYIDFLLSTTKNKIGFVKFQSAFFEAYGSDGIKSLAYGINKAKDSGFGVILDAKRGDIGSTAEAYARAYLTPKEVGGLSDLEVDCMTINPFLGPETMEPFVERARKYGKGLFILAKTSNPGAGWIQEEKINDVSISEKIARLINNWAEQTIGNSGLSSIGAVVGVTYPKDGIWLRQCMPTSVFLAPGLGAQGGKITDLISLQRPDKRGVVISASRGITKAENQKICEDEYGQLILKRISEFQQSIQ